MSLQLNQSHILAVTGFQKEQPSRIKIQLL